MKPEQIAVTILTACGEARGRVREAMDAIAAQEFDRADEFLKECTELFQRAHSAHILLIQDEARGELVQPSLLIIHALDIMIAAESERDMAEKILQIERARS
jgi:PTS system cellobiose-specific IIA component